MGASREKVSKSKVCGRGFTLDAPKTAWYKGMGRPEMMGPRVGAAEAGVKENRLMDERPDMFAGVNQRAFDATTLANQQRRNALWGSGPATVSAARPWANLQPDNLLTPSWAGSAASADRDVGMGANRFLQLGDPRNIRSGPDLPPASSPDLSPELEEIARFH